MTNAELCLALMNADSAAEVISLLTSVGYWTDQSNWRYLGDIENNYSTAGGQQAEAIAALAEKIINAIDARLINACIVAGVDPTSEAAPPDIRRAVARFFGTDPGNRAGLIANWTNDQTLAESLRLTVSATGCMPRDGSPSLSIADGGEGQTPDEFPATFMSISRSNKLRIPFVQGRFNMGGTGALAFCGKPHHLQLVVSRRNPALLGPSASVRDGEWGFTVLRREPPAGNQRNSFYSYLAPVGAHSRDGEVLSFAAEQWPIFPEANAEVRGAYERASVYGSLLKLYEYSWKGTRSNIVLSGDGLLQRLDQALPELALPVRLYECRPGYKGHAGSFATNLTGLSVRLDRDRADKLEGSLENPRRSSIDIDGCRIRVRIFVFKSQTARDYRTARNAILFVVNGQTHATFSQDFFSRAGVGLGYLADSLLVILDCSEIDGMMREDLFMTSRDRIRSNDLADRILEGLESMLKEDQGLRELQNKRRKEEIDQKLKDDKPLASAFQDILRSDPTLERLFLSGQAIAAPFSRQGTGQGTGGSFKPRTFPTYFRFRNRAQPDELQRSARLGSRPRIEFETDADNTYFDREDSPGDWAVFRQRDGAPERLTNCRLDGPRDGLAILHIALPEDVHAGDTALFEVEVTDDSRVDPFVNRLALRIEPEGGGGGGGGSAATPANRGQGNRGGSSSFALPNITRLRESDWHTSFHTFCDTDALWVVRSTGDDDRPILDFYVNVDNKYLRHSEKTARGNGHPGLMETRFVYANVIIGMAMLNGEKSGPRGESDDEERTSGSPLDTIALVTSALAPVIVPMVEVLAKLSLEDVMATEASGVDA